MPPKFSEAHFDFPSDAKIPEHEDVWPSRDNIDPGLFRIEQEDSFDKAISITACDIETIEEVNLLLAARKAFLIRTEQNHTVPKVKLGLPLRMFVSRDN